MGIEERFKDSYKSGKTPWDVGKPDFNLIETVQNHPVPAGRVLDVGCGAGDNSIWLAQNGFDVTGTDVSDIALGKAMARAEEAGVSVRFFQTNFMKDEIEGGPFGFLFDRGYFHLFGSDDEREAFVRKAAGYLEEGGLWLTIAGNKDENRQGPGPPQRTAGDIVRAAEPLFEILLLQTTQFGSNHPNPPRAWRCLMKKRL